MKMFMSWNGLVKVLTRFTKCQWLSFQNLKVYCAFQCSKCDSFCPHFKRENLDNISIYSVQCTGLKACLLM